MLTAQFMTRKLTKEFIEKNGRTPTKDEFITIQHEAVTTLIKNNSVYGICGQGETKMPKIELSDKKSKFFNSIKVCCNFEYMTKEMYENFVKQGKKFVTLVGGHVLNSLEESCIDDLDGDIVIVDGQKYAVDTDTFSWRK